MIRVAHIGPPLARQGGPAGYLYQLHRAACEAEHANALTLPPIAPVSAARRSTLRNQVRAGLGRVKRAIAGSHALPRPSLEALAADHGHIELVMTDARARFVSEAGESLQGAFAASPDVFFCHDTAIAEHVLGRRAPGQQVWLMIHNPMPVALYLTWNWGVPECDWRDVAALPDVRRWSRWEFGIWEAVDGLIFPCEEALAEVARIDAGVTGITTPVTWLLSGASADALPSQRDRRAFRRAWKLPLDQPVGLYLGNHQAYRGLDALLESAQRLDVTSPAGTIAIAGPPRDAVPHHPRLVALGHVSDVAGLLAAVDFVINVNRFSLFDLSTIEALEAAKPLLLHAVGGNMTFGQLGAGIVPIADLDRSTIAAGLCRMFSMPPAERDRLAGKSRSCYGAHLTRAHLWARHRALYERGECGPRGQTTGQGMDLSAGASRRA